MQAVHSIVRGNGLSRVYRTAHNQESNMPSVLVGPYLLRGQDGPFRRILREGGFEVIDPVGDFALTADQLRPYLPQIDALLAGGERMTPELLAAAPRLRSIARTGVGYDLIDVPAATTRKIAVSITPGTNHDSVAEQAFALILALARRVVHNDRVIHGGGWDRALVNSVRGKTIGFIGLGRIGKATAIRAHAFGMRILAHDAVVDAAFDRSYGVERADLETLLAQSDYVSLHLPLTAGVKGMVNRDFLARMKPGACLVNTARGGLVVEQDLADALKSGQLAGAGLDVLCDEPPRPGCPLLGLSNVVLSPHIAGTDIDSMAAMAEMAAQTIVDLYHNRWPGDCVVNPQVAEGWKWGPAAS